MRLDTRAFGIACGLVTAMAVFGLTILWLVARRDPAALELLEGVLFGYSVTVGGAFVGALWAYVYGFLGGALLSFVYNVAAAPPAPPPGDRAGG